MDNIHLKLCDECDMYIVACDYEIKKLFDCYFIVRYSSFRVIRNDRINRFGLLTTVTGNGMSTSQL